MNDPLVERALALGATAHAGQKRKFEGTPYFSHPFRVAQAMSDRHDATPVTVAAALLHDTLEDTQLLPAEIEHIVGPEVLELVRWLTSASKLNKSAAPREERKRLDRERLGQAPKEAKILKMLDRLDNLKGMLANPSAEFRKLYGGESLELLALIGDADSALEVKVKSAAYALIASAL